VPVPVITLNLVQVLAFACFGLAMGAWVKRRLPVLDRINIPASIVGGLIYAFAALIMRDRYLNLEMDLVLRPVLQNAFFTTIGLGASLTLLKHGGAMMGLFWLVSSGAAVLQNLMGIGLASAFGLNPLLGIVTGSVALTGGPATALAIGGTFEEWGATGSAAAGVAAAMFGIAVGGLIGGAIGGLLIKRNHLHGTGGRSIEVRDEASLSEPDLLKAVLVIAVAMGIGSVLSSWADPWLKQHGMFLPAYIGAMISGSVLRNLDDHLQWIKVPAGAVEAVGDVALNIFIVMALLTLELWQIVNLAGPLVVILVAQTALVALLCVTVIYWTMGRDYNAAVTSGGFAGFMMGTTANAMACMTVLTSKFGPAPRAFIVVPLVGAFLIDFTNALIITTMAGWVR